MDNKNKADDVNESSEMDIEDLEEFRPLQFLSSALNQRIHVSTSRMRADSNDSTTSAEFVGIEGPNDSETLECLEEAVSDIIAWYDGCDCISSSRGNDSENEIASEITDESSANFENSSSKKGDSFYSIPSVSSSFDSYVNPESLQNAEEAITDLEQNGPAGLVHLSSLSAAVEKPIRIWCSGTDQSKKIGRTKTGEPIDIEYHQPLPGETAGHYTLRGNREPRDVESQLNDCLFAVVADQTGRLAPELRKATIDRMRKNVKSVANRIKKIAELEKCDRISLLLGGARYTGRRPQDAKKVIDDSQHGRCHPDGRQGHPRGHASHPEATGSTDSAENYSRNGWKTAFLNREDQDAVAHLALQTTQAQRAMDALNRGATNIAITVRPGELEPGALPQAVEFSNGQRSSEERPIRELVIVLRHHEGQHNNPDANVFVHTFYPKI